MVVIAGIVYQVFGTSGIVNNVLSSFHIGPVNYCGGFFEVACDLLGDRHLDGGRIWNDCLSGRHGGNQRRALDAAYMDGGPDGGNASGM